MRRRDFVLAVGGAAAWPLAARAQESPTPVVGFLSGGIPGPFASYLDAFRRGLEEIGYIERRNIVIEYRWAEGQNQRLPSLAVDLARLQVNVIVASGGNAAAFAATAATRTIPIVFGVGSDPVRLGLVASLNRPNGNATGVSFFTTELEAKRLGLLRELIPTAALVAVLLNPTNTFSEAQSKDVEAAARELGCQVKILHASSASDLDSAFAIMAHMRPGALLVGSDPFFNSQRDTSLRWQRGIPFRRCTNGANLLNQAG